MISFPLFIKIDYKIENVALQTQCTKCRLFVFNLIEAKQMSFIRFNLIFNILVILQFNLLRLVKKVNFDILGFSSEEQSSRVKKAFLKKQS